MTKSATDIMQDVINAAVVDAIVALKDASQGLPNALMRDLASIHANAAFADLPPAIQKAVAASVRDAFSRGHPVHLARPDDLLHAQAVAMCNGSGKKIADR